MNRSSHITLWMLALLFCIVSAPAVAQEEGWPRTLPVDQGLVTIYPLQVEGIKDDVLHYRAALAWRPAANAEPVFGAGWFESKVVIDQTHDRVYPLDLTVVNTRFPEGTENLEPGLAAALAEQAPGWNLDFSLDELNSALKTAEAEARSMQELNTAPPKIVYRDHPALLVTLDGEPVLRQIENSAYTAVINTPYPLISDGNHYFLNVAKDTWYRADRATGPYRFEASPPAAIAALVKPDDAVESDVTPTETVTAANAPEIVVATEPTELIVTDGPAVFVPLVDDLLVLQNSDDDVFMHVGSQQFYVVLAGRWYHADSMNGPWDYQAANQLPPAFANIPDDSEQADSRVYVAGTPEAKEAVLDAQLPQTAAVERGSADVEVEYDGDPEFKPVDGTDLEYAANTGATVLQSDRLYYLVEDGVWYVSRTPNGPWEVAAQRPAEVSAIAPTSPVYSVKYVYIYDVTPDVVYVGYTPGYFGSYVYRGTVVYGTGWYYRPWVSPYYYYPRPSTWGFHVAYDPWGGWNFGLSWGWGWGWSPFYTSYYSGGYWHDHHYWHHRHYGYWGPRGYRPRPPRHGHGGHDRDHYAYDRPGRSRPGDQRRKSYRGRNDNLYRDSHQRARIVSTRDKLPRQGSGHDAASRQAGSPGVRDARSFAGRDKKASYRAGPVRRSDLRLKAQVRDANSDARRKQLLADRSGTVHSKTNRKQVRDRVPQPEPGGKIAKAPRNGAMPVTGTRVNDIGRKRAADKAGLAANRPTPPTSRSQAPRGPGNSALKRSGTPPTVDRWLKENAKATARTPSPVARSKPVATPAVRPPTTARRLAERATRPTARGSVAKRIDPPVAATPRQYAPQPAPRVDQGRQNSFNSPPPAQHAPRVGAKSAGSRQGPSKRDAGRRSRDHD
jgi:hypothetical protein